MISHSQRSIHPLIPALLVLIAAIAWQAGASSANSARPPAAPTAVATIDLVTIFDQLQELKDLETQLEARKVSSQLELDEVNNQLKVIRADLDGMKRGTDEYKNKVKEAMEMTAVINARGEALNQILSIERGNLTRTLYLKVSNAIERISEREGYDVVLFDDSTFIIPEDAQYQDVYRSLVTRSLLYRHSGIDITNQVVSLMNSEYTAP
jgi:Skp family chaperone for outer membrane proteins